MKKLRLFGIIFVTFILLFLISIWVIFNTAFGNNLLKTYFQKEINTYLPSFKIEKFKAHYNNFSMVLRDGMNSYKLIGRLYPFNAILDANIKEIKIDNKVINISSLGIHNLNLKGDIVRKNNSYVVTSNVYFNKSSGLLNMKIGKIKTISFDVKDINYSLKNSVFPLKILAVDINMKINKGNYVGASHIKAFFKDRVFNLDFDYSFNTLDNIKVKGNIIGDKVSGKFKGKIYKNTFINYDVNFTKFDLNLMNFIYPFKGVIPLELKEKENIIKFVSLDFKGFKDKKLNIQFKMPVNRFFYYTNLENIFLKGDVNGRIVIDKNGYFNFIIENAKLKEEIAKKLKLNNFFKKIFVNGVFDKNKIIFDLLTKSNNKTVSIKNGVIYLNENLPSKFIIAINSGNKELDYKFQNNKLILIHKKILKEKGDKILVF